MNHLRTFCLCAAVLFATGALAQGGQPAATPAPKPTIATSIESQVRIIEREFVSAAEAMPEDKYNFAPSSLNLAGSEFKGVRTFAEQVKHVAATNFMLWGAITGEKSPVEIKDDNGPASLKTKAEIVKYLKDSFALGHKAAQAITAESAVAMIPSPFGQGQTNKLFCATFSISHAFDHYGQMVEYLRMNGIVPPASRGNEPPVATR